MKVYTKMKYSGMERVSKIPEHWKTKRLKFLVHFDLSTVNRRERDDIQIFICHYPHVYNNEFISTTVRLESGTCNQEEFEKFRLKKDDVIITKDSETPEEIGVPVYIQKDFTNAVSGYHLAHLSSNKKEMLGSFLFRFLQSNFSSSYFETEANGVTRFGLKKDSINNLRLILPPTHEQKQIVSFLDQETSRIDSKIQRSQKLIELLKEKKQTTISHAVTKGMDPSVVMKDSGIEWIGKIPEHWNVKPLKFQVKINQKTLDEKTDPNFEFDYVDIGSVHSNGIIEKSERMKFVNSPSRARRVITKNDTIISTVRTYLKAIGFIDENKGGYICSTGFAVVSPILINAKFLYWLIVSPEYVDTIMANSVGVTYPAINAPQIGQFPCILPNMQEQKQIASFLDKETSRIDSITQKITTQIEKLQEYRKTLISQAVTGKIDIRRTAS